MGYYLSSLCGFKMLWFPPSAKLTLAFSLIDCPAIYEP